MFGYGIGLSFVREFMWLFQGIIVVESMFGKGVIFILKFFVEDKMSVLFVLLLQFEKFEFVVKGVVLGKVIIFIFLIVEDNEYVVEFLILVF